MDITRGGLDDISRPASSERSRPGSRVSVSDVGTGRACPTSPPRSLVVLSNDAPDIQEDQSYSEENLNNSPEGSLPFDKDLSDEENEDPELQKAIKKMRRLDKVLASRISNEKEVKRRGKELHQKLWQELLQIQPKRSSECSDEAENTRMFLALTPTSSQAYSEEGDFVPVFGTQVPDQEYETEDKQVEEESVEAGQEERRPYQTEGGQCEVPRGKKKQDFVKKNIELASGAGGQVPMTQEEKDRLAELLRDIEEEEEEEDNTGTADCEGGMWAVPAPLGQGYTPEPSELDKLIRIDSRLQLLLPVEDFLSVRSSYPDHSVPQGLEAGWDSGGDSQPGEKVLQDIKERRGQERRLHEIQQQLELLGQGQDMTSEDTSGLVEEQLRDLLEDCEISQSRSFGLGTGDSSPRDNSDTDSLLDSTPRLSLSLLSELLRDAYTTSFSQPDDGTTTLKQPDLWCHQHQRDSNMEL